MLLAVVFCFKDFRSQCTNATIYNLYIMANSTFGSRKKRNKQNEEGVAVGGEIGAWGSCTHRIRINILIYIYMYKYIYIIIVYLVTFLVPL